MILKASIFVVLVSLCVPPVSFAQSSGSTATSIENLNLQDIAEDSIVVLSKNETGVPGYIHAKYVYVHTACPGRAQLVDYYGAEFDVNDRAVRWNELRQCLRDGDDPSDND
jgi:hypothetical protein